MSIDPVRKAVNKTACSLYEINAHIRYNTVDFLNIDFRLLILLILKIYYLLKCIYLFMINNRDNYLECLRELSTASKNDNREVPVDVIAYFKKQYIDF